MPRKPDIEAIQSAVRALEKKRDDQEQKLDNYLPNLSIE